MWIGKHNLTPQKYINTVKCMVMTTIHLIKIRLFYFR